MWAMPPALRVPGPARLHVSCRRRPHEDYQTEWWYYTGNLTTAGGQHVGYQLTIFRRGLTPGPSSRSSDLGSNQVYFAHLAFTDVAAGSHTAFERFSRGALALAGASGDPYHVWL